MGLVGHPLHQARAWRAALRHVPDGGMVLKARTDRSSPLILRGLARRLQRGLREPDLSGGYPAVFQRRLCVPYFNPNYPFLFHDIEFAGLADDARLLCNLDLHFIFDVRAPSPEGFFYAPPFARYFWEVEVLLSIGLFEFSREGLAAWYAEARDDSLWQWLWLFHMQLAHRYFEIGWEGSWHGTEKVFRRLGGKRGLERLCLEGEPHFGLLKHATLAGAVCRSTAFLDHLDQICADDPVGELQLRLWNSMRHRETVASAAAWREMSASLRARFLALPAVRDEPLYDVFTKIEDEVREL